MKEVRHIEPEAVLEGPLESVSQAVQWFNEHPQPDLILADIQLSDGVSFDIFRQVPTHCPSLDELLDPAEFYRASRQHTVRKESVEGYRTHYSGRLELLVPAVSGEAITISKEKVPFFRR